MEKILNSKWQETEIGRIPIDWGLLKLDDISLLLTDGAHKSPKEANSEYRMLSVKDMNYDKFDFTNSKTISKEEFEELKRNNCQPQKGDILISKDGANCLDIIFVYNQEEEIVLLSSIAIVRLKKGYDPNFYRYYLLSRNAQYLMRSSYVSGTAIPRVVLKDFKNVPVPYPEYEEQVKIGNFLRKIDDKIEINNQMNQTLEEMAQAVFKEWFVEFNFPDENGVPYRDNGGEMVDSELGPIPKGWREEEFYNIAEFVNGKAFKGKDYCEISKKLPIVKIAELKSGITSQTRFSVENVPEKYFLADGDILFSWSGNPDTSLDAFIWTLGEAVLNQHIFKVNMKELSKGLTYTILKYHMKFFKEMARNKQTTGLGHVTVKNLKEYRIPLPNVEVLDRIEGIFQGYFDKIFSIQLENEVLMKTRGILLPKLMSGEIRV